MLLLLVMLLLHNVTKIKCIVTKSKKTCIMHSVVQCTTLYSTVMLCTIEKTSERIQTTTTLSNSLKLNIDKRLSDAVVAVMKLLNI